MRSKFILRTLHERIYACKVLKSLTKLAGLSLLLAALVSLAASAPVIYAVSARDVPNRTTQVSIVLSTIDSNGTVTDLGPIIRTFSFVRVIFA